MQMAAQFKMGFYYEQLGVNEKWNYRKIAKAVSEYQPSAELELSDQKLLHQTMLAVKYDNPELCFWNLDKTAADGRCLRFAYDTANEEETIQLLRMLRDKRKEILEDILKGKKNWSQKEILKGIFDYLADTTVYAEDELQKPFCSRWIYDISGVLLREKAVCLGIAMTVNYLCSAVRIPSVLITGEARGDGWSGNHGWNLVKPDGVCYHLDAARAVGCDGVHRDKFFLMKDSELTDRVWPKALYPKAE